MKKRIFTLSILLNLVFSVFALKSIYYRFRVFPKEEIKIKKKTEGVSYFLDRDQLYKLLPAEKHEIVFIGDSHTQRFPLDEIFKRHEIKNRGIDSDIVKGIYLRLDEAIDSSPDKVFIMAGINDLNNGYSIDTIMTYYNLVVNKIQSKSKGTKIYIQTVIPVLDSNSIGYKNTGVLQLNKMLYQMAKERNLTLINLQMNKSHYCSDRVHLNGLGYLHWAQTVKPYL